MDSSSIETATFHPGRIPTAVATESGPISDDDDSSSDVSMSAETEDDEEETINASAIQGSSIWSAPAASDSIGIAGARGDVSNKRKLAATTAEKPGINDRNSFPQQQEKRHKSGDDDNHRSQLLSKTVPHNGVSLLPAEVWQHIFTFIPPRGLGILLCVNRSFRAYLDPLSPHSIPRTTKSATQFLTPDAIWQASRRLYQPGMPAPLKGKSELDMWKMACSPTCQFCEKKRPASSPYQDQWHAGPGDNGVIPVWSFGIRTCGPCLENHIEKEVALLLSSEFPTPLLAALPVLYFSNELHVIPQATVKNPQYQAPPAIRITKTYFKPHVSEIKREYIEVKTLGSATAEEWVKGLDDRGAERRNDAARWDKWEANGGILRMRTSDKDFSETRRIALLGNDNAPNSTNPQLLTNGQNPASQSQSLQSTHPLPQIPHHIQTSFPFNSLQRFNSPLQPGVGAFTPRHHPPLRQERTKEQVAEMRAARRTEIERRCMLLDQPLTAGVLAHMGSFQAAMQIVKPLDDDAWELLKPRLISQRIDAEQRENERLAQIRVVHEQQNSNQQDMQVIKSATDSKDQEWDDMLQAPLRARMGGYADETIRDGWASGQKVSKDNCSQFAAQVLIYIRKRFYAEVAKDDAAIRAAGHEPEMDPPNGPFTRKLTLENMKWVFDTKIKPHTEHYRKEIFLCNDCEVSKFYGFEGVIQHYAAKHTNALSLGSIVVHWKSEWPEYTPFNPEPPTGKSSYYSSQAAVTVPSASAPYTAPIPQQVYGFGVYPQAVVAPIQTPHPPAYHVTPGPYYGNSQHGDQYTMPQNGPNGPYGPPQVYQEAAPNYQTPQYSVPPPAANGYSEPSQDYSQQGHGNQYPPTSQGIYMPPQPGAYSGVQYPISAPNTFNQQPSYPNNGAQYNHNYSQSSTVSQSVQAFPVLQNITPAPTVANATPKPEGYNSQLQDVAKNARDVWDTINGLKDVPGSVKVYTIIYHVIKRSRFTFPEDPSLAMIVDGLQNNKDMRKVRNINGLQCKVCLAGSSSVTQKKHFSFPQLVNHFHSVHEQKTSQSRSGPVFNWTNDMVELPDLSRLQLIAESPGMNDERLKLIGDALPQIFAPSKTALEKAVAMREADAQPMDHYDLPPGEDSHEKYYSSIAGSVPSNATTTPHNNEQYDPRRPLDLRELKSVQDSRLRFGVSSHVEELDHVTYQDRQKPHLDFGLPKVYRAPNGPDQVVGREAEYLERQSRHHDVNKFEYRGVRDPATIDHDPHSRRDYRTMASQAYLTNKDGPSTPKEGEVSTSHTRYSQRDDNVAKQTRIFAVAAQISEQAKQAWEQRTIKQENIDIGSEDGELRANAKHNSDLPRMQPSAEVIDYANRFLNQLAPSENVSDTAKHAITSDVRPAMWQDEQSKGLRHVYSPPIEPFKHVYEEDSRAILSRGRPTSTAINGASQNGNGYIVRARSPEQRYTRVYDDRYNGSMPERRTRERSPELVDRRFVRNNVIYREERQGSNSMQRTPSSRFARYESVRLENDRARSRSPVYVKIGTQPGQYKDRSPGAHPSPKEPVYRTRTPAAAELAYERTSGHEYYRVYADEPRRQHQYVEAFEYVRVASPRGDYMIRRPIREAEPIYTTYESEQYVRKPVYESRAPLPRVEQSYYEEEYDPRHPEPPPSSTARQIRYQ